MMGQWSACRYGRHRGPYTFTAPLPWAWHRLLSSKSPAVQWGAPSHSRSLLDFKAGKEGYRTGEEGRVPGRDGLFMSVVTLLTSRRSTLPAPSMSAHAPLPHRLDLTVGGDDGENLASSRRGWVCEKRIRRNLRLHLHPTGQPLDSSTSYGSIQSPCWCGVVLQGPGNRDSYEWIVLYFIQ